MSGTRRVLVSIGAPVVVAVGLAAVWGGRGASSLKHQIEMWADSLEHSPNPVEMRVSVVPFFVDGERRGKLSAVIVQRSRPGTVDSLRLLVDAPSADADRLASCALQLDPDAFDRDGPFGLTRVLHCATDTSGLVRFGTVALVDGREVALYLDPADLPCEHLGEPSANCTDVPLEIERIKREVAHDVRNEVRHEVRAVVR